MKKLVLGVAAAALFAVSSFAMALNIGVVDMQKVMQNAPQVKAMQNKLKSEFGPQEQKLQALQKQLQADVEKFEKNSSIMKDSDKKALAKKIAAEQKDLQNRQNDFRTKVLTAQNEAMQKIFGQIQKIVNGIASDQKLNLILTKTSTVYSDDDMDVTDQVIKKLK